MDADTPAEWTVLRAADLRGLMADYATFEEHTLLTGEEPSMAEWAEQVEDILEHYLSQDICLTPEHDTDSGVSEFHANTQRNLQRFRDSYG